MSGLVIENYYLNAGQYVAGNHKNRLVVLHHTAGHDNPYNVIDSWNRDTQGRVATEFVIGGCNCSTGRSDHDGRILKAFPDGGAAHHIGKSGLPGMTLHAVGIELCSMGHVKEGKNYVGGKVLESQICTLDFSFRGYRQYHRYSERQIEALRILLLHIAERDNIDLHQGLCRWIKNEGARAFEFHEDAYYGRVQNGIVTHANIRRDKEDVFPQPELIDMLSSL